MKRRLAPGRDRPLAKSFDVNVFINVFSQLPRKPIGL